MREKLNAILRAILDPRSALARSNATVWVGGIGVVFFLITIQLLDLAEVSLQYWYLTSIPILLAGFRFGRAGAMAASIASLLVVLAVFRSAGHSFEQASGFIGTLLDASTSAEDASRLAGRLADLRANDPISSYQRAITGLLLVIVGGILMGTAIDNRNRAYMFLEQIVRRLGRYFSPQLITHITSEQGEAGIVGATARREITLLFADLRDFTAISERMEPEEIVTLLNEYFNAMTEEIFRQDGTLDKFIGDGIMAFFGDPVWHPDHTARAFRASLAMHQRMRELHVLWEERGWSAIGMGLGVTTGVATVGNVGSASRIDYTAIGSIVNVAARLSSEARAGQTLTTRRTYHRVEHLFAAAGREPTMVKGFTEPFDIVDVIGPRMAPRDEVDAAGARLAQVVAALVTDDAYRTFLIGRPAEAAAAMSLSGDERDLARHVAVLCGYPLLRGVPTDEITALISSASVHEYQGWTVVVREGVIEDRFYVILSGEAAVTRTRPGEPERHIASLSCGEHFGEIGLLHKIPRIASVRVTTPTRLLVMDRASFFDVMEKAPVLRGRIEATAARRLAEPLPTDDPFDHPAVQASAMPG